MSKFHAAMQRIEELASAEPATPATRPPRKGPEKAGLRKSELRKTELRVIPSPPEGADAEATDIDTIVSVVAEGENNGRAATDAGAPTPEPEGLGSPRPSPPEAAPSPAREAEDFWRQAWERGKTADEPEESSSGAAAPPPAEPAPAPKAEPGPEGRARQAVAVRIGARKALQAAAPRCVELVASNLDSFVATYGPCLSKEGMFLAVHSPLRSGTPVEVYVRLRSGETLLRGAGAVAWARSEAPGLAVRFVDLDESSLAFVESVVSRHISRGGVPFDIQRGGPTPERHPSAPTTSEVEQPEDPGEALPEKPKEEVPEEAPQEVPEEVLEASKEPSDGPPEKPPEEPAEEPPTDSGAAVDGEETTSAPADPQRDRESPARTRSRPRVTKRERTASQPAAPGEYAKVIRRLVAARNRAGHRVFLITSATPRGGASTLAQNLAGALASDGSQRVVLVDANLRAPIQHLRSRTPQSHGLADVLRGDVSLGKALESTPALSYALLCSGRPPENPAYFLSNSPLDELIGQLRKEFDWVIVDGPPTNSFPEAAILAKASDAALLVLEAERTRWEVAEEAKTVLESSGVDLLGTVLNRRKHHIPGFLNRHL